MAWKQLLALASAAALASGCVTAPAGPQVMALPGSGKTFTAFQQDDRNCRAWASEQIGLAPGQPLDHNTATGATIGTLLGAAVGTLFGVAAHDPGAGAAIGAGTGLAVGSASGASVDAANAQALQGRYDSAYTQCMYAAGDQVPAAAPAPAYAPRYSPPLAAPASRRMLPPAPPPGMPPPPPPAAGPPPPPPPPPGAYPAAGVG